MLPTRTSTVVHGTLAAGLLLSATALVAVVPASATSCLPGAGTSVDPFQVADAAALAKVGADAANGCTLAAHYRQTADIVLAAPVAPNTSNHSPIGASSPFTGVYDGGGHAVDGVVLDTTGVGGTAFFADIRSGGLVRDLTLTGLAVTSAGGFNAGGLVGVIVDGELHDVHIEGSITTDRNKVGGIAAYAERTRITGASMTGTVVMTGADVGGGDWVGGLIGHAIDADIEDARAAVVVRNEHYDGELTGGLVGQLEGSVFSRIRRSVVTGSVEGYRYVGGMVGLLGDIGGVTGPQLSAVTARADVLGRSGGDSIGGLIGATTSPANLLDLSAHGDVTVSAGAQHVAGLVGWAMLSTIERGIATGTVVGTSVSVGGALAYVDASATVTSVFWDVTSSGQATSGGGSGAVGVTTAALTSPATFASWPIVAGWEPYNDSMNRVWGICRQVNDGYPFLLWEYDADPCTVPVAVPSLAVSCSGPDEGGLAGGVVVSCTVSGGDPEIDLVWRAAYNPVFAEGVVRTGADGTGVFSFVVPVAAAGSPVTVELVAWTAPIPVGTAVAAVGGPVPSSVPSGGGPSPVLPAVPLLVAVVAAVARLRALRIRTPMSAPSNV